MNEKDRGKIICDDLAWHGVQADWFLDPMGELFLVVDGKWLMKCIGERKCDGEKIPYWAPVRPTYRSQMLRQMGKRKLEYVPLFD